MMKDGLLEKIKSKSYWRINFQPVALPVNELSLPGCNDIVQKSRVELRGWDYPHISTRNDHDSGYGPVGQYYEHWIEWDQHIEFWRMYRSSQFLHYRALSEDWLVWTEAHSGRPPKPGSVSVLGSIWLFTEVFEFLFRLYRNGLYEQGVNISIKLENSKGRHLWIGEFDRAPFSYDRATAAETVEIKGMVEPAVLASADHGKMISYIIEFFENFDWSPRVDVIHSDQQRLLKRTY